MLKLGFKPTIMCIPAIRLNHCATSVDVMATIVTVYVYCFTWRLVTNVRRRTSRAPRPRHDVAAGPSLNMDLFKAEVGGEAGLGGADVAAHSGPMEEEPAT